jgi:mono/diheme cytochrome c family protein
LIVFHFSTGIFRILLKKINEMNKSLAIALVLFVGTSFLTGCGIFKKSAIEEEAEVTEALEEVAPDPKPSVTPSTPPSRPIDPVISAGGISAADLDQGQMLYSRQCGGCHGARGEGRMGPNLTDEYTLYGGTISAIQNVIKNGHGGMPAFGGRMSDTDIFRIANYVNSIVGSNPPGAKPPQGNKG